jgi:hypothetical protein
VVQVFSKIIKVDESQFPASSTLLMQEAVLTNSSLLSGFEYLINGGFDAKGKGAYYAAFFDLTIGFERLMKLAIITDHMVKNDFNAHDPEKLKRKFGHNLLKLINKNSEICNEYGVSFPEIKSGDINHQIIRFLTDFADAQKGRYFNITNTNHVDDPIAKWKEILQEVARQDFSEKVFSDLENKVFSNLNPALQLDDIAHNTGYVQSLYEYRKTLLANRYALWRIMSLLNPIAELLSRISDKCHEIQTTTKPQNFPSIQYFDEVFLFRFTDRKSAMRRKRWTHILFS